MSETVPRAVRRLYLVECYSDATGHARALVQGDRIREAALDGLAVGEPAVDYVGSIRVPQDEVVFHLFRSTSATAVADVCRRAAVVLERIVESVLLNLELVEPATRPRGGRHRQSVSDPSLTRRARSVRERRPSLA